MDTAWATSPIASLLVRVLLGRVLLGRVLLGRVPPNRRFR
jgi:hypothetical protein